MPVFRKGQYGELGHWGKKKLRFPSKKILALISILLILGSIFIASKQSGIIPYVFGDYNTTFQHSRTPIFTDIAFTGISNPAFDFDQQLNSCGGAGSCASSQTIVHAVTSGEGIIVILFIAGVTCLGITDSPQSNPYTQQICNNFGGAGGLTIQISTSFASATGTDTVTVPGTGQGYFADFLGYTGVASYGGLNTATGTNTTDDPFTHSLSVTGSFSGLTLGAMGYWASNFNYLSNTGTIRRNIHNANSPFTAYGVADSSTASDSWTTKSSACQTSSCSFNHVVLNLIKASASSPKIRWNFNSTCVTLASLIQFDYSKGSSGPLGNNCSSADIAISKAPANLQTAAGRMLEMVTAWENGASTTAQNVTLVLRTNGTLPSFTENYNPFNDVQARLVWTTTFGTGNTGTDTVYVGRDNTKTITQESLINDLVIQGSSFFNSSNIPFNEQAVLNFTGSKNFLGSFSASSTITSSNNTASGLQFGEDYYILLRSNFNTAVSPCGGCVVDFVSLEAIPGTGTQATPISFGIFSTPASCNDPLNQASCSGQGTPVFQFNPLDPSSWGNAIIKGLLWVFTVALPAGLQLLAQVLTTVVRVTFNTLGSFGGYGTLGDNIVAWFAGTSALFGSFGTAFGWLSSLVSSAISSIGIFNFFASPYFTGLTNALNDFKNAIGSGIIVSMINEIAFWFPNSYIIIMISFYFLMVMADGIRGFFDFIHLVRWSTFGIAGVFLRFLVGFINLITWLLGRFSVISPGHKLHYSDIPHPHAGPFPRPNLVHGDWAFFHDPTSWFFSVIGVVFTVMYSGTAASGLPTNTTTIIAGMQGLWLTLFGIFFFMMIMIIPMWILGKLRDQGILEGENEF